MKESGATLAMTFQRQMDLCDDLLGSLEKMRKLLHEKKIGAFFRKKALAETFWLNAMPIEKQDDWYHKLEHSVEFPKCGNYKIDFQSFKETVKMIDKQMRDEINHPEVK